MMRTHVRPVRDLRNNYAEIAELIKNHDQVIITKNGRGDSVLISIEEYAELEKIRHERYVAGKLAEAEALAADPKTKWYSHEEFWSKFEV
ncbi:MAG: type II toxin-antitoxin system prevent-host-death family antitoxin [Oscillospiraceae bacterium]|nr:type II toxin-antitoxin system prevent-host-death family antitoxin [Oscillospiraceae bacterium]